MWGFSIPPILLLEHAHWIRIFIHTFKYHEHVTDHLNRPFQFLVNIRNFYYFFPHTNHRQTTTENKLTTCLTSFIFSYFEDNFNHRFLQMYKPWTWTMFTDSEREKTEHNENINQIPISFIFLFRQFSRIFTLFVCSSLTWWLMVWLL